MVRRISLLFSFFLMLACGGAGGLLDGGNNYPLTKTLTLRFTNAGLEPVNLWLDFEGPLPANVVAAGGAREDSINRTWVADDDIVTFLFNVQTASGSLLTLNMHVFGAEAQASNFGGFEVLWNGTELSATTEGGSTFPVTKTVAFRLENNSSAPANITVDPETPEASNLVAAAGARIMTQARSWNSPTENQQIVVRIQQEGKPNLSVTHLVSGDQASNPSFTGIAARWDGTDLVFRNLGDSIFPYVKGLKYVFRNTGVTDVNLWAEPDTLGQSNLVLAGASREIELRNTWNAVEEDQTFRFHAGIAGESVMNVSLDVDGQEAQAGNFIGFEAVWDGTSLTVQTIG